MGAALAAAVLAIGATGCGGASDAPGTSAPGTALTVSRYDGERLVGSRALDCTAGGEACARVVALLPDLDPAPGEVCAQIYGGPERIVVEGTVAGRPVSLEATRTNGCAIARYDRLEGALQPG